MADGVRGEPHGCGKIPGDDGLPLHRARSMARGAMQRPQLDQRMAVCIHTLGNLRGARAVLPIEFESARRGAIAMGMSCGISHTTTIATGSTEGIAPIKYHITSS